MHDDFDTILGEIERARKALARVTSKQVRSAELRDFFKATAFSWFRTHRSRVATSLAVDLVDAIDRPYRALLDATEKASAKNTYVEALSEVKIAIVAARGTILTAPITPTSDVIPDFTPLATDAAMRDILARRWGECSRCLSADAPLAATVMMGGLLEALFVGRANRLADKSALFNCSSTPTDFKSKKALDLRQWMLASYIDVGYELKWISRSGKDVAAILRDYRNFIHPEKERSHGVSLTRDDASLLWEITKTLCRELLSMKGCT